MNAKVLLPILIALHVAAAALIVDGAGLRIDEPETGRPGPGWQIVEWNPGVGCMPEFASEDFGRFRSGPIRELNATGTVHADCGTIH